MVEQMLADLGFDEVESAGSVDEALRAVAAGGFDLAVLDMNLNGTPSHAIAEALRAAGTPCILATGYAQESLAGYSGFAEFLQKPFAIDDLGAAIRKVLPGVEFTDGSAPGPV
jgi:DNA-binding NtrC family response regulator